MKIVQITDTHLSHRGGVTRENFERIAAFVNEDLRPDLVVHTGDAVVVDPDAGDDRHRARELMARFTAPVRVLPGNHDIGDGGPNPWKGIAVTDERVSAFEQVWGPDHWRHDVDGATVLGLDSELLGVDLDRAAHQWRWLEATVTDLPLQHPVLLFLHKPLWPAVNVPTEIQMDVGDGPRARLVGLLDRVALLAVGSGHLHRYRQTRRDGVLEVWAPSTAFLAGTSDSPLPDALHRLGVVEYECSDRNVQARFRAPVGLTELVGLTDVPELRDAIARIDARAVTAGR